MCRRQQNERAPPTDGQLPKRSPSPVQSVSTNGTMYDFSMIETFGPVHADLTTLLFIIILIFTIMALTHLVYGFLSYAVKRLDVRRVLRRRRHVVLNPSLANEIARLSKVPIGRRRPRMTDSRSNDSKRHVLSTTQRRKRRKKGRSVCKRTKGISSGDSPKVQQKRSRMRSGSPAFDITSVQRVVVQSDKPSAYLFMGQTLSVSAGIVPEEGRVHEFKLQAEGKHRWITKCCVQYSCAFLNSDGGTIWFGIKESETDGSPIVIGVGNCHTHQLRDALKGQIMSGLLQCEPPVNGVVPRVDVRFVPVVDAATKSATNRHVLKVSVQKPEDASRCLYRTCKNTSFVRNDHGIVQLSTSMVAQWTRRRCSYLFAIERQQLLYARRRDVLVAAIVSAALGLAIGARGRDKWKKWLRWFIHFLLIRLKSLRARFIQGA